MFYFTRFEGNRQCLLWYFYLATFRLPLGFYANLEVNDDFPPNVFPKGGLLLLQDFAAPFFIFLKPAFQLKYASCKNDLAGNQISLQSSFRPGSGRSLIIFDIAVHNRLLTFSIHNGKQLINAAFEK
ncbi:MAG TPA: hypothetical protein DCL86_03445 [Bacteroidales bacterium]|nr:hypothetical protein [Bacteroidales bacterium]